MQYKYNEYNFFKVLYFYYKSSFLMKYFKQAFDIEVSNYANIQITVLKDNLQN